MGSESPHSRFITEVAMEQTRSTWHVALNVLCLIGLMLLDMIHPTDEQLKEKEL